jgi:thiamine biosynthesis lipoprotein ApbE
MSGHVALFLLLSQLHSISLNCWTRHECDMRLSWIGLYLSKMADDQKQAQVTMERTVDPFRALKHQIEEVRPKITGRENEIVEWKAVAEQLARANAHLTLDTPGAVDEALEEMRIALWQARFELANRKPTDQKLTQQKLREFIHDLDAAQRKLRRMQLARPHRELTKRDLHKETLHRAIAKFVALAEKSPSTKTTI